MVILSIALCFASALHAKPAEVEVLFSSKARLDHHLIDLIDKEERSIRLAVYHFTHKEIADALIRAKNRGVDVELLIDPISIKRRSPLHRLHKAKIPIFVWQQASKQTNKYPAAMHNKFCVFSGSTVWTGSFNFTYDGSARHKENVVVLKEESVARDFIEEFNQIKDVHCILFHEEMSSPQRSGRGSN